MSLQLYIDEDAMRGTLITALRAVGLDVVTVAEANRLGYPDDQQLTWATKQQRVLYSFNVKDFSRLHNAVLSGGSHAGIILVPRQRYSVGEQLRGLLKVNAVFSPSDLRNQLIYLSNYIDTE